MEKGAERILVKRSAALGDVLLATAVLPALTQRFPGVAVDFATSFPEVLQGNLFVDQVVPVDDFERSKYRRIFDLDLAYEKNPTIPIMSAFAAAAGLRENETQLSYTVPAEDRAAAEALLLQRGVLADHLVALQSGSSFWLKNWPTSSFEFVAMSLRKEYSVTLLLLGSEDDPPVPGTIDLRGVCGIGVSVAVLSRCIAFIGLDSALLHFAKALGKPVAGFFGHSDPALRITPSPQDCLLVTRAPCRFCHHRHRPPVIIPVCERESLTLRILDTALHFALRRWYARRERLALRLAKRILFALKWREKGGCVAECMADIDSNSTVARLSEWLGQLGVPGRAH